MATGERWLQEVMAVGSGGRWECWLQGVMASGSASYRECYRE